MKNCVLRLEPTTSVLCKEPFDHYKKLVGLYIKC